MVRSNSAVELAAPSATEHQQHIPVTEPLSLFTPATESLKELLERFNWRSYLRLKDGGREFGGGRPC